MATASACGWAGFVCGPPVIGRLSAWASLPVALGLLPLLTAFIVAGTLSSRALRGWLRLNPLTLRTLLGHARRTGAQLALLSNAPEPLARAIDHSYWSRHFDHRYYSCRLGTAKPDPQAFQIVLNDLGAQPGEVLFIDDRAENTRTARDLGMHAITFASATALDRELRLTTLAS